MSENITVKTVFENGKEYFCDEKILDVFPEECFSADGKIFGKEGADGMRIPTAFYLRGKENVVLDFRGAILRLHGKIQPFILQNCKNVTVKNCTVEYTRSLFSEGTLVRCGWRSYRIRFDEKFPFRVEDGNYIPYGENWENKRVDEMPFMFFQMFHPKTREGNGIRLVTIGKEVKVKADDCFYTHPMKAYQKGGDLVLKGKPMFLFGKRGKRVVIEHEKRILSNVLLWDCENVTLKNYRILNGNGMGISPIRCKNIYLDGLKMVYDELSHGFVSNSADGIHAIACSGDFVLENSIIEGTIDDILNIHGNFFVVKKAEGNRLTVAKAMPVSCDNLFKKGDHIAVSKENTIEKTGEYTVTDVEEGKETVLVLSEDCSRQKAGEIVENITANPDITVRNCSFGKTNTHLRFQSRGNCLVENCTTECPFLFTGDITYWYESGPCKNFTVRNVRFVGKRAFLQIGGEVIPTEKERYYHENIRVENCSFERKIAVEAKRTNGLVFVENTNKKGKSVVLLKSCGQAFAENAKVVRSVVPDTVHYN